MVCSGYILDLVAAAGLSSAGLRYPRLLCAVVPADVLSDGAAGGGLGGRGLQVDQVALDRAEERLGKGVVPGLARAPMREVDVEVAGQLREASV
jgi:hypothetical protein